MITNASRSVDVNYNQITNMQDNPQGPFEETKIKQFVGVSFMSTDSES